MTEESRVGIFIDSDNFNADLFKLAWSSIKDINGFEYAKAFGDWDNSSYLKKMKEELILTQQIELVQQRSYCKGKNATDIALSINCVDSVNKDKLNTVVIFSGDSDFTPLAEYLIARGIHVIGIGSKICASHAFTSTCSQYLYLEELAKLSPDFHEKEVTKREDVKIPAEKERKIRFLCMFSAIMLKDKYPKQDVFLLCKIVNMAKSYWPEIRIKKIMKLVDSLFPEARKNISEINNQVAFDVSKFLDLKSISELDLNEQIMDLLICHTIETKSQELVCLSVLGNELKSLFGHSEIYGRILNQSKLLDYMGMYGSKFFDSNTNKITIGGMAERFSDSPIEIEYADIQSFANDLAGYVDSTRGQWGAMHIKDAISYIERAVKHQGEVMPSESVTLAKLQQTGLFQAFNFGMRRTVENMILVRLDGRSEKERKRSAISMFVLETIKNRSSSPVKFSAIEWMNSMRKAGVLSAKDESFKSFLTRLEKMFGDYFYVIRNKKKNSLSVSPIVDGLVVFDAVDAALSSFLIKQGPDLELSSDDVFEGVSSQSPWLRNIEWSYKGRSCLSESLPSGSLLQKHRGEVDNAA